MTAATELWAAVVVSYDVKGLTALTNIRVRSGTGIVTAVGEDAAQAVINLWPSNAQEAYDSTDAAHVEVGKLGVIAVLWRRGGSASTIEQVKWDTVFGSDGAIVKLKRTGARGRRGPSSNSEVQQSSNLTSGGRKVRGWSDVDSLPLGRGYMPKRVVADGD